jgi:selenocysteine lyase/cysteine desulfurase
VLLDAAAFVPSNRLSLREVPADFVPVSFYKMFGYPTGVGALIARRDALSVLRRPWFAGGTVEYVSVAHDRHSLAGGAEAFEDGTPNFLAISAVLDGLAFLSSVGMERIRAHVRGLIERLLAGLGELHHPDGSPLVLIHGPRETSGRGGTVALNVLDAEGHVIPFDVVEREAGEARIAVRGGCFCNPGAAEAAFGLADQASLDCLNRFEPGQFSPQRFAQCLDDRAVGAVRVSVGIGSTQGDVDRFITFLSRYRGRIFGSTKGGIP